MPHLSTPAIICAVRHHGEHGAVVRLLTPDAGLVAGYVRGGRSRALRPVLMPGNRVKAEIRARTADQLASVQVELAQSLAPILAEPLPAAAIDWSCALTAAALPEQVHYPALYAALGAVLDAILAAPAARGWAVALIRYELLLLAQMGFGLDLSACVMTGAGPESLAYVSPRTGAAVSREGALGYEAKLLVLPAFLRDGTSAANWSAILDGLALTRPFLERSILIERRAPVLASRDRLVDRLKRAVA